MQKMLEVLSSLEQRFMVMTALSLGAVTLACDTNGHLVVLYCLNNFPFEFNEVNNMGVIEEYELMLICSTLYCHILLLILHCFCLLTELVSDTFW